jgi:hypothetical protein
MSGAQIEELHRPIDPTAPEPQSLGGIPFPRQVAPELAAARNRGIVDTPQPPASPEEFKLIENAKFGVASIDANGVLTYRPRVYDESRDTVVIECKQPERADGTWQTTRFMVVLAVHNMGSAQHRGPNLTPGAFGVGCAPEIAQARARERAEAGSTR